MTANLTLTYGSLNLTATPYLVEFGLDMGAPQNEANPLAFLLQDGEIELSSRASNRTFTFNVLIEGATLSVLATAEAALIAETEKVLNTLTVDPGDGAPATVFDIYRGQVSLVRDDNWELNRMRRYTVTVRALPFGKSSAEVVTAALPASGSTTVNVDTGSSATGWSGAVGNTSTSPTSTGTAITLTDAAPAVGIPNFTFTRTGSITTSATPYIVVDWQVTPGGTSPVISGYGSTSLTNIMSKVAEQASPTAGYTRTWFSTSLSGLTGVTFLIGYSNAGSPSSVTANIDNVDRSDTAPSTGAGKQLFRGIDVVGSARTAGAIAIEHATSALGDVLAIFWKDDGSSFTPNLRQFRVSGGSVTADGAMVSGSREPMNSGTPVTLDIPVNRLLRDGYTLLARLGAASSVSGSITWTATTRVNGVDVGPTITSTRSISATTTYQIVPLGRVQLPTRDMDEANTNATVRITMSATVAVLFDEGWISPNSGQMIVCPCGTGTPSSGGPANRMFIEPPSAARPRPSIRIGFAADRSDSFYPPSLAGWQMPVFPTGRVNVFTVTTNATYASVSFRHFPRWHTNSAS